MSHLGLCNSGLGCIWGMSFGIISHLALCGIWTYVNWDCVILHNVVWLNVVERNVFRPTVGVSIYLHKCFNNQIFADPLPISQEEIEKCTYFFSTVQ